MYTLRWKFEDKDTLSFECKLMKETMIMNGQIGCRMNWALLELKRNEIGVNDDYR